MTKSPNSGPLKDARSRLAGPDDDAKWRRAKSSDLAVKASWDDFFDEPGIDLGSRDQPPLQ